MSTTIIHLGLWSNSSKSYPYISFSEDGKKNPDKVLSPTQILRKKNLLKITTYKKRLDCWPRLQIQTLKIWSLPSSK